MQPYSNVTFKEFWPLIKQAFKSGSLDSIISYASIRFKQSDVNISTLEVQVAEIELKVAKNIVEIRTNEIEQARLKLKTQTDELLEMELATITKMLAPLIPASDIESSIELSEELNHMVFRVRVKNVHAGEFRIIEFPLAKFLTRLFDAEHRLRCIDDVKQVIEFHHNYNPNIDG